MLLNLLKTEIYLVYKCIIFLFTKISSNSVALRVKRPQLVLALPAERQRSFSNTELYVVRLFVRPSVCLSVKSEGGFNLRNAFPFWHRASLG